ncbi:small GTP-binding protein [Tritrichomonas foetus]|uniref:Small GTP-binding protein n=1 Tax=Tritrichomonas foetus TaxID=1144522 RepID=A0A1J4KF55_9EUKA|nr:small GTP-binding protein [Tritrichomonas foetus]|eukprot:OHT08005.1 small GTP-binding protein [Tritrichomonas foetus]
MFLYFKKKKKMKMMNATESKVILVGEPSVGKTSLISQFNNKVFESESESTVGASFVSKAVNASTGPVQLHIWDTAGQERYRSLIPMYSRNSTAAILVIDTTNIASYTTKENWIEVLKNNCPPSCRVYVCANKIDLDCVIPVNELQTWAENANYHFFKTSAKDFASVEAVFKAIAEDIIQNDQGRLKEEGKGEIEAADTKKGCCS